MDKIRMGSLAPADIAYRRMVPAMVGSKMCDYIGVSVRPEGHRDKADRFVETFGGKLWEGYDSLLSSDEIDAVYIALPPAFHYEWARKALLSGKHVLLEKPFTVTYEQTQELIQIARDNKLAVTENFAFIYHPQIRVIRDIISSGQIGELRIIRTNFGFPFRGSDDFRYVKELGGGALLDCGCYTLKLADLLLGSDMKILSATLFGKEGFDIDMYGTVCASDSKSLTAQLSFGMDQQYCCELQIWGSKGCVISPRIYTAPAQFEVNITVKKGNEEETVVVPAADQFMNSLEFFCTMITDDDLRNSSYEDILRQSRNVDITRKKGLDHE